jgi:hypothetical protein
MKILNVTTADWLAPARPVTIVRSAYHPPLLGLAIFLTGKGKLLDLEKPTHFFRCLGIPFRHEQAILAGATECVGCLLLLLGLALRLISIPLMILLTVAYLTADIDKVRMIFSDPDKFLAAGRVSISPRRGACLCLRAGKTLAPLAVRAETGAARDREREVVRLRHARAR